mmetsp:Transcript_10111/g.35952  ORF Transcript_10111/g.35952 Transcript_10111/m.35952 type:complete len:86 (-) Transcript_10111:661-918(-)
MRLSAVVESSPDVGSSSKITEGLYRSSCPMATLFFSPPEMPLLPTRNPPMMESFTCAIPKTSRMMLTLSLLSLSVMALGSRRTAV